jgi:hypothetical protein
MQRRTQKSIAIMRDYQRRVKEAATEATIVGTKLGPGRRKYHVVEVESSGFELRRADGTTVVVASGVRVDVFCDAAKVDDSVVTVPEGTTLLFLPPDVEIADAPYKQPGAVAYTRGDSLMLFARDSILFAVPGRQRRTSIARMVIFGLIPVATIVLCVRFGPNTQWNILLFLQLVAIVLDQTVLRGLVSWIACTRPPPPLSAGHRAIQ